MANNNIALLEEIANAMQDLNERLVYVGGAVTGLYATTSLAMEPRPTIDVDCIVNTVSYSEHTAFEESLRAKHFQHDQTSHALICRWIYNGVTVDVIPIGENALLFGNPWYLPGYSKRIPYMLPSGKTINILSVTYYIATKIHALYSRGGCDWRGSKDFEDIVYVLNYCTDLINKFTNEDIDIKTYVSKNFFMMLKRNSINEEIECALSYDESWKVNFVLDTLKRIANYNQLFL